MTTPPGAELFRAAFDALEHPVALLDSQGTVVAANRLWSSSPGADPLAGATVGDSVVARLQQAGQAGGDVLDPLRQVLSGGGPRIAHNYRAPDGRPFRLTATPLAGGGAVLQRTEDDGGTGAPPAVGRRRAPPGVPGRGERVAHLVLRFRHHPPQPRAHGRAADRGLLPRRPRRRRSQRRPPRRLRPRRSRRRRTSRGKAIAHGGTRRSARDPHRPARPVRRRATRPCWRRSPAARSRWRCCGAGGCVRRWSFPSSARGRALGTITLGATHSGRRYTPADLAFAATLGERVGARGGQRPGLPRGPGSEPDEGRVPRHPVPRAAHAAERHRGLGPRPARRPARQGGGRARGGHHRPQRARADPAHLRHPRRLAHRHRQAAAERGAGRAARGRRGLPRSRAPGGGGQGDPHRGRDRPARGAGLRRRRPAAAGGRQPARRTRSSSRPRAGG